MAMFAGAAARDDVVNHVNTIGNVMNMEQNAHTSYDKLRWGIEAEEEVRLHGYLLILVTDPSIRSNTSFEWFPPILLIRAPRGTSR